MARPVLLGLQHPAQPVARKRVLDGLAAVPVDDAHVIGRQRRGAVDHVPQQRPTGQRLQHFRQVGAHARSLACREDDRGESQAS